ncbi:MAG: MerR family transcriptional regulator [Chloroflexi bacterium]|nr:MAG: MerR family transcriptional regulator [Chloroflexota bacterium]
MNEQISTTIDHESTSQSFAEVTELLDVAPGTLRRWIQRFGPFLQTSASESSSHYTASDVETLSIVRGLLAEGNTYEQIAHRLKVMHSAQQPPMPAAGEMGSRSLAAAGPVQLPRIVGDAVQSITDTQKAILNSQTSIRDLLGVVVQDNFSLKEENRKLRERMLEIERALAEYQRREETRKERLESRLRALEGTLGALQQQVAHWVEIQRQRRRGWFG